jgi:hypothetical protein
MRSGINEVKYFVCQIDLLLDAHINKVERIWTASICPAITILAALMRKLDQIRTGGQSEGRGIGK